MTDKEKEAVATIRKSFPNMSNSDVAQLLGIWKGEANLKKSRSEAFPLFVNEKNFAEKFASPFQSTKEAYPTEESIVKKYKTKKGSKQTKQLLEEERSLWVNPEDRANWYKNLKNKYNIPPFDSSKSYAENKANQNKAINNLTPEQKKNLETEFYDKVYGSEYSTVKGGFYGRGIGPIQVTGTDNIIASLRTAAQINNKPEWNALADEITKDPSKIETNIRNNPELETALSMAWVQNNLINKDTGGLKGSTIAENNRIVNRRNEGLEKKSAAASQYLKYLNEPAPKTSDQQIPYPVTPEAAPEFNSMEELLQSKGVMPTSSAPPVSDTYRMEGYNAPYKQTTEPVNINTEPTGLENPFLSVKNWWNSL